MAAYAGARNQISTRDTKAARSAMQRGSQFNQNASQEMLYALPPKGKFDREKSGQFQLIFPFNERSAELAMAMNKGVGARANMGGPNLMKMMVDEVKKYDQEYSLFLQCGKMYAPE